jgi:DNA-3-methyladenine glycosylase I
MIRCPWATNELSIAYHDKEWCVPNHDDTVHFEFLVLEGAQAGLSWDTILRKRERYRTVFAGFDPERVARFTPARIERALQDPGIIRNRMKVAGAVQNARAFMQVRSEFGSFDAYVWRFVDGKPVRNRWKSMSEVPATTPLSDALGKDLRKRGFTFVGSTICYSFMQAVGLVNDHIVTCFRYRL